MNLTNIEETPLHAAFDACVESAAKRGLRVTGLGDRRDGAEKILDRCWPLFPQ